MSVTVPPVPDQQKLERALTAEPVDPERLEKALTRIEEGLSEHAAAVESAGGLIRDADRINRPSLERQESKVLDEVQGLRDRVAEVQQAAAQRDDDPTMREQAAALAPALQKLRDAEADLAFDAANTDLGSGE